MNGNIFKDLSNLSSQKEKLKVYRNIKSGVLIVDCESRVKNSNLMYIIDFKSKILMRDSEIQGKNYQKVGEVNLYEESFSLMSLDKADQELRKSGRLYQSNEEKVRKVF